jgi:hypothetical protein
MAFNFEEPLDPEQEEIVAEAKDSIAALMEEASHDADGLTLAREHIGALMLGYIEAAKEHEAAGNHVLAQLLAIVSDDFHTVWHLVDDGIAERDGEEPHDHSDSTD